LSLFWVRRLSRDIPADAGFLFNKAAVVRTAIQEIHWIIYRGLQKPSHLLYHDKLTIKADEWRSISNIYYYIPLSFFVYSYTWQYISAINVILYKHYVKRHRGSILCLVYYVTVNTVLGNKYHSVDKCAFSCGKTYGQNVCPTWQLSRHLLILICMRVFICLFI
jgi:hypothetical protein